ncbi:MAG: dihydrofolate reductase [Bacteroidota bacterium]
MKLALIAAVARNRVIGRGGRLPWRVPGDLKRFKALTTGHALLMGRRTYESLGKPLPDRRNVVVTSRPIPGVECHPSVEAALSALREEETVFVIGGGELYRALFDSCDLLYLTLLETDVEGDTLFPDCEEALRTEFRRTFREQHDGYVFADYVRVNRA